MSQNMSCTHSMHMLL